MSEEKKTWKCNKCGYEMEFVVHADKGATPDNLGVCGIANATANCTGMMILQDDNPETVNV